MLFEKFEEISFVVCVIHALPLSHPGNVSL
jgi:hypothetical protein